MVTEHRANLIALRDALPLGNAAEIGDQARAVLALVLDSERTPEIVGPESARQCPNCGTPFSSLRTPYCSEECKEEAAFVRQFRSSLKSGAAQDPERQIALGQKLWRLLGGGYPLRLTLAEERTFAQVWKRTGKRCEVCGAPAVGVDHIGSG